MEAGSEGRSANSLRKFPVIESQICNYSQKKMRKEKTEGEKRREKRERGSQCENQQLTLIRPSPAERARAEP